MMDLRQGLSIFNYLLCRVLQMQFLAFQVSVQPARNLRDTSVCESTLVCGITAPFTDSGPSFRRGLQEGPQP